MTGGSRHPGHGLYRPDIDGLRCVAVLGVVFCHLKFSALSGGFVGVDVFFVISGYLISRNILNDLRDGRFSLMAFYDRRIRRIFPALFVTIAGSFIVGLILNSPEQFRVLAGDTVSALFSIVNIRFWKGAHDYFATSSDQRTLLHLWSLSVEEQFYLVWPALLLLLAWLKRPGALAVAILLLASVSLVAAQLWLPHDAAAVFYLTPFRIFEFALGALVVLAERRWSPAPGSMPMFAAGLVMIAIPMVLYSAATPFPAMAAIVPVLGTGLVIYSQPGPPLSSVLGNRLTMSIGRISYSLYLCHWPVIVFARHIFGNVTDNLGSKLCLLAVMAGLAAGLYRWVERPFRASAPATVRGFWRLQAICAILLAVSAVPAYVAFRQDGWSWRYNQAQQDIMRKQAFGLAPCADYHCVFGNVSGPLGVQIIGDSYAQQYVAALHPLLLRLGKRGESYAYGGCLMLEGIGQPYSDAAKCRAERDAAIARVRDSKVPVLIAQAWSMYPVVVADDKAQPITTEPEKREAMIAALSRTLAAIDSPDRPILLIGGEVITNCNTYATEVRRLTFVRPEACIPPTRAEVMKRTVPWNSAFFDIRARQGGRIDVLVPEDHLCTDVCNVVNDGLWLYRDSGHLTVAGAEFLACSAQKQLMTFLQGKLSRGSSGAAGQLPR